MSKVEVNTVEPQCGTTLTLGGCGDTVALGSGASQTGFGRTGTVDWVTTVKTNSDSPITAVSGEGYFLNTTAAAITINLPTSPAVGDIVSVKDYARTFATYNVTVGRGGSNMDGGAVDTTLDTSGTVATFIYMDAAKGWSYIQDETVSQTGITYIVATGGSVPAGTICGDYKSHSFTGPGTFAVSSVGVGSPQSNQVSYTVVAGGGGAAMRAGGGGGAGGFREGKNACDPYTASPLASATSITVTATPYAIAAGGGGAGVPVPAGTSVSASNGVNSSFSTIISQGGGGSIGHGLTVPTCASDTSYGAGGSGAGGSAGSSATAALLRNGDVPDVTPNQGFPGGAGVNAGPIYNGGGGGGASAAGTIGSPMSPILTAGRGGDGVTTNISGSPVVYAGGGGGGGYDNAPPYAGLGKGGSGGGGNGGLYPGLPVSGGCGSCNTGGGGGGGASPDTVGGTGGSGIVILRYRFQ